MSREDLPPDPNLRKIFSTIHQLFSKRRDIRNNFLLCFFVILCHLEKNNTKTEEIKKTCFFVKPEEQRIVEGLKKRIDEFIDNYLVKKENAVDNQQKGSKLRKILNRRLSKDISTVKLGNIVESVKDCIKSDMMNDNKSGKKETLEKILDEVDTKMKGLVKKEEEEKNF